MYQSRKIVPPKNYGGSIFSGFDGEERPTPREGSVETGRALPARPSGIPMHGGARDACACGSDASDGCGGGAYRGDICQGSPAGCTCQGTPEGCACHGAPEGCKGGITVGGMTLGREELLILGVMLTILFGGNGEPDRELLLCLMLLLLS